MKKETENKEMVEWVVKYLKKHKLAEMFVGEHIPPSEILWDYTEFYKWYPKAKKWDASETVNFIADVQDELMQYEHILLGKKEEG